MPQISPPSPAPRRVGPRPLWLHLGTAAVAWSTAAIPAAILAAQARGTDPRLEMLAMVRLASDRFSRLSRGIDAYHAHPYYREMPAPRVAWRTPGLRLLDYGAADQTTDPPVLIVPSLINRYYILDLRPGQSFVRWLASAGLRPMVVAWDDLQASQDTATVDGCIINRLEPALSAVLEQTGQTPMLIGYCLGGLLALALAMRRTADVSGLVFMATPWDFHAGDNSLSRSASQVALMMEPMLQMLGSLPIDAVQTLFYSLDPFHVIEKFLKFADLDQSSDQATAFVALEDWLNDGLAMPAAIARTLMSEWYGANSPAAGAWRVNGQAMRPADLPLPSLVLVPSQDRIVPPPGALALDAVLTNSTAIAVNTGHIGMVSSRRAPAMVWRPLLDWMQQTTGIMPG